MKKYIFVLLAMVTVTLVGTLGGHDKSPPGSTEISTSLSVQHDALASATVIDMTQNQSAELSPLAIITRAKPNDSYAPFRIKSRYHRRWCQKTAFMNRLNSTNTTNKELRFRLGDYPKLC